MQDKTVDLPGKGRMKAMIPKLAKSGDLMARLAAAHPAAHLQTPPLLTAARWEHYGELRGHGVDHGGHDQGHGGHSHD